MLEDPGSHFRHASSPGNGLRTAKCTYGARAAGRPHDLGRTGSRQLAEGIGQAFQSAMGRHVARPFIRVPYEFSESFVKRVASNFGCGLSTSHNCTRPSKGSSEIINH
jgi:hypothetical protein